MKFLAEHRSNGLTYITVMDGEKVAGAWSCSTADWAKMYPGLKRTKGLAVVEAEPAAAPTA